MRVAVGETDLWIGLKDPQIPLNQLRELTVERVLHLRRILKVYIAKHPEFKESLRPVPYSPKDPELIQRMGAAAQTVGVGPMAAVAGAIAQLVGEELLPLCSELIIENGGDIFLYCRQRRRIGILAGNSPFSGRLGIVAPQQTPMGVCTSAGTSGHSLSLGRADAAVVIAADAALADAAATHGGNLVQEPADIPSALEKMSKIPHLLGVLLIKEDKLGAWGQIELEPL